MKTIVAVTVAGALTLAGCASTTFQTIPSTSSGGSFTGGAASASTPCGVTSSAPTYEHIVWIVLENHGTHQVVHSAEAPYLNSVISKCGLATNFHALAHPSLPNYIALTSGSTQGIANDGSPSEHPLDAPSVFSQLGVNRWRSLSESMPSNCFAHNAGDYAPRHNPPVYYTNIADQCANQAVALGDVPDISAPLTFIVPNMKSDMHDESVGYGDNWMSALLPKLLETPEYRAGNTAVFITFDEDENDAGDPNTSNGKGNQIPTIVIAPSTPKGSESSEFFTHYSILRTAEENFGLDLLGEAKNATSMKAAFNL